MPPGKQFCSKLLTNIRWETETETSPTKDPDHTILGPWRRQGPAVSTSPLLHPLGEATATWSTQASPSTVCLSSLAFSRSPSLCLPCATIPFQEWAWLPEVPKRPLLSSGARQAQKPHTFKANFGFIVHVARWSAAAQHSWLARAPADAVPGSSRPLRPRVLGTAAGRRCTWGGTQGARDPERESETHRERQRPERERERPRERQRPERDPEKKTETRERESNQRERESPRNGGTETQRERETQRWGTETRDGDGGWGRGWAVDGEASATRLPLLWPGSHTTTPGLLSSHTGSFSGSLLLPA